MVEARLIAAVGVEKVALGVVTVLAPGVLPDAARRHIRATFSWGMTLHTERAQWRTGKTEQDLLEAEPSLVVASIPITSRLSEKSFSCTAALGPRPTGTMKALSQAPRGKASACPPYPVARLCRSGGRRKIRSRWGSLTNCSNSNLCIRWRSMRWCGGSLTTSKACGAQTTSKRLPTKTTTS